MVEHALCAPRCPRRTRCPLDRGAAHLGFGIGSHFCLGANLARFEITVLFEELLARTEQIEPAGPAEYRALGLFNPIFYAIRHLPVRLRPA